MKLLFNAFSTNFDSPRRYAKWYLVLFVLFLGNTIASAQTCTYGTTWTARSAAEANQWTAITYGNGLFVAVANSGTNRVMTSPDGITWTARSAAEANQWTAITYGNGLFVAVANSGTNRVMTSPDGITWTARSAAEANSWTAITYGNGLFVAVSSDGTNRVMTSSDGITWVAQTIATSSWAGITYGNGLFVAVSSSPGIATSPDGITWTTRTSPTSAFWVSVTHGNNLFVAVAAINYQVNNRNRIMTSADGTTWTARLDVGAPVMQWSSVTYANGVFVAVASNSQTNRIMTSTNGTTWTGRNAPESNTWRAVTYSNSLLVAVASGGTNRVMTSGDIVLPSVSIAANTGNNIVSGTSVTFTATPTNGGTSPSYQWKKNGNNVGTNSATYTDASLANNDVITCVLTSNDNCTIPYNTVTSNSITMTVTSPISGTTTATCGNDGTISVNISSSVALSAVRYIRIQQNKNDYLHLAELRAIEVGTGNNVALNKPSTSYSNWSGHIPGYWVDGNINTLGHSLNAGTQEFLEVDLGAAYLIDRIEIVNRAECCQDRADNLLLILKDASMNVVNSRQIDAYQGQNSGYTTTWNVTDVSWADGATTLNRTGLAAGDYTINYSDIGGTTAQRTFTIQSSAVTPSVSIAATPSTTITTGTPVTFTATPTNGGTTPTYQWKKNSINVGTNSTTYTDATLANNDVIACVLTSNVACATTATATSNNITITVSVVLPIELTVFNGQATEGGNLLTWQTAEELNASHFDIEKSLDGKNFYKIGVVKTKGNYTNYEFSDDKNNASLSYYRLKMNDLDNKFSYSKTISILREGKGKVKIYPSVTADNIVVEGAKSIEIVNALGQVVMKQIQLSNSTISLQSLPSGIYFVRGEATEGGYFVEKIIKE